MKSVIFGIFALVVASILAVLVYQHFGGTGPKPSSLEEQEIKLEKFMSRERVIELLGPPTWLIREGDKNVWATMLTGGRYRLFWRNRPCDPMNVQFNANGGAEAWTRKQPCNGEGELSAEPSPIFACSSPDRAPLCN